jgi:hypothetical protein
MNRYVIAVGIACVLLSSVSMQAQTLSSEEGAPPNARNTPGKSESPVPVAHKPVFVPTGLDLNVSVG